MDVDLTKPWGMSDIAFILEEKPIYVNKTILSMASEVFKKMFTADFREKELAEIPLPGKTFDTFLEFMKVIHPPHKKIAETSIEDVLPLAHEYSVQYILASYEEHLLTKAPSVKNLVLADLYGLANLHQSCSDYVKQTPLSQLEQEDMFDQLNPDTMVEILTYKVKRFGDNPTDAHIQTDPTEEFHNEVCPKEFTKEFISEIIKMPRGLNSLLLAEEHNIEQLRTESIKHIAKMSPKDVLDMVTNLHGDGKVRLEVLKEILKERAKVLSPLLQKLKQYELVAWTINSTLQEVDLMKKNGRKCQQICPGAENLVKHTTGKYYSGRYGPCTHCQAVVGQDITSICVPILEKLNTIKNA